MLRKLNPKEKGERSRNGLEKISKQTKDAFYDTGERRKERLESNLKAERKKVPAGGKEVGHTLLR